MAIIVTLPRNCSKVLQTAASVFGSRAVVASSRIRSLGRRTSERAIAMRWRWPPESLAPRSPTTQSISPGKRGDKIPTTRRAQSFFRISATEGRISQCHVCKNGVVEHDCFLWRIANHASPHLQRQIVDRNIVYRNLPPLGTEQTDYEIRYGGLARSGRTGYSDEPSGGNSQKNVS